MNTVGCVSVAVDRNFFLQFISDLSETSYIPLYDSNLDISVGTASARISLLEIFNSIDFGAAPLPLALPLITKKLCQALFSVLFLILTK